MSSDDRRTDARGRRPGPQSSGSAGAPCSRAGWPSAPARPARRALLVSAGASIERALAIDPLSTNADPERHPPRRLPHAGEPLVRPLLRHAVGRAGLLGPRRSCTNKITGRRVPVWDQYGYQPGVGVDPTGYLQPFDLQQQLPDRQRRLHQRHLPRMGHAAPELERREDGRLRRRRTWRPTATPTSSRPWATSPRRLPLLLRAGRRLHHLRRLPLLGARAHRPQPRHGAVGHHRPRRRPAAVRSSSRRPGPAAAVREVLAGPPCPSSCSMRA